MVPLRTSVCNLIVIVTRSGNPKTVDNNNLKDQRDLKVLNYKFTENETPTAKPIYEKTINSSSK